MEKEIFPASVACRRKLTKSGLSFYYLYAEESETLMRSLHRFFLGLVIALLAGCATMSQAPVPGPAPTLGLKDFHRSYLPPRFG